MNRQPGTYTVMCPMCGDDLKAAWVDDAPSVPTGHQFCGNFSDRRIAQMEQDVADQHADDMEVAS